MPRNPKATGFIKELDAKLDDFCNNTRFFHEPFNEGRAQMFVMQHRLNTASVTRSSSSASRP